MKKVFGGNERHREYSYDREGNLNALTLYMINRDKSGEYIEDIDGDIAELTEVPDRGAPEPQRSEGDNGISGSFCEPY